MKRLFLFSALLLAVASAKAVDVREIGVGRIGSQHTIYVSTFTWTVMIATPTVSNRAGFLVNNPTSNTADFNCTLATGTPSYTIGTGEIEIQDAGHKYFEVQPGIQMYCISLHTSSEAAYTKEVGQ